MITDPDHLAGLDRGTPTALAPYPLARPMHYTSGTTGRSKGVWSGLWDAGAAEEAFADEADLWSFGPERCPSGVFAHVPLGLDPVRRRDPARAAAPVSS